MICYVERCTNWCSLFQKQFGKIPLKIYFHMCFGPGGCFELYYKEYILRTDLQNMSSKICLSKMSWSIAFRNQRLETASVTTSGKLVQHNMWIHIQGSIQYETLKRELCL